MTINPEFVVHLTLQGLLSYKQYGFPYSRSTAYVFTVDAERMYQALKNDDAWVVVLDISKSCDKICIDSHVQMIFWTHV